MTNEEAKIYAAERVMNALVSGQDFKGLGPLARGLVQDISQPAHENALLISNGSERTTERWQEMQRLVTEKFVKDILGFNTTPDYKQGGRRNLTLREATDELVDGVWWNYIRWAENFKKMMAAAPPSMSSAD